MPDEWKNKLYFGDNLDILRESITSESIDLIYLDPPFNSKANRLVQDYLGHRNIAHTVRYTRTAASRFEGLWR